GSDGVQACASCHFHSGADSRLKNQINPASDGMFGIGGGPNHQLTAADFPFHELADPTDRTSAVIFDTDDVSGSAGVAHRSFNDIVPGGDVDDCDTVPDPVWNIGGVNTRQVTGRNTPSAVNAVFNFRNFWDGRASFLFNGVDPVGPRNPDARILEKQFLTGFVFPVSVLIDNGSLASQSVGPPLSGVEMSCDDRTFPKLGKKLLSLTPLGKQLVAITDSVLGPHSNAAITVGTPGLSTTYKAMIEDAFDLDYWDSDVVITFAPDGSHIIGAPGVPVGTDEYTMMEANFALFWGLAIQMYESTLVSDDTPFDRFLEGNASALTEQELQGMAIFFGDTAKCGNCHAGPELSGATTSNVGRVEPPDGPGLPGTVEKLIEIMGMADGGIAAYDSGFYNIGVRPTTEDPGIGGEAAGPICFARRSEMDLPIPEQDVLAAPVDVVPGMRVACDGAFKTPMLRNVEFTAPYFHNGGQFTLEQVVEFYNRGGDFPEENLANLDPDIQFLGLQQVQIDALVAFLEALSDDRVRFEQGPFDHPELFLVVGHPDGGPFLTNLNTGKVEALFVQEDGEFLPAAEPGQALLALGGDALPDTFQRLRPIGDEGHCVGIDGSQLGGLPFVAASCDDLDICTIDFCDPLLECVHLSVSCDDGNACTVDSCHQTDGCQHTPVGCDDGNPCTDDFCGPL
ncbi:MAG: cytochrome c peroxidase, partial [Candidatus Binatia bacterium]